MPTIFESSNFSVANQVLTTIEKMFFPIDQSSVDEIKEFGDTWGDRALSAVGGLLDTLSFGLFGPSAAQRSQMARVQNAQATLKQAGNDYGLAAALRRVVTEADSLLASTDAHTQNGVNEEMWEKFVGLDLVAPENLKAPSILTDNSKTGIAAEVVDNLGISGRFIADEATKAGNAIGDVAHNTWEKAKEIGSDLKDKAASIFGGLEIAVIVGGGLAVVLIGAIAYAIIKNPGRVKESAQAASAVKGVFR